MVMRPTDPSAPEPERTAWQERHIAVATEGDVVEQAAERLLEKLEAWLQQQPEWSLFIGLGNRRARRTLVQVMSRYLLTIPTSEAGVGNRAMRRQVANMVRRMAPEGEAYGAGY